MYGCDVISVHACSSDLEMVFVFFCGAVRCGACSCMHACVHARNRYRHLFACVCVRVVAARTIGACNTAVLLGDQQQPTLVDASPQLPLPPQFWHPLAVVVKKEPKKVGIPATELTHDGGFLDGLLALLGEGLVGDLRSVVLHDADHVVDRDVGYLSRWQLPEFMDLAL